MRLAMLVLLCAVPFVAGCGEEASKADTAADIIAADWDFNSDIPGHPELKDTTVDKARTRCREEPDGVHVRCRLLVHGSGKPPRPVPVLATFDDNDVLVRWDLARR
jgi:hypothetical protein